MVEEVKTPDIEEQEEQGNLSQESSKNEELLIEAKSFFDSHKKELAESLRKENNVIFLDFMQLTEFSNKLSDEILSNPEEALQLIEQAIEQSGLQDSTRVRLTNLPKIQEIKVRNIRSKHLNELVVIEGIIRQASDVRPQVVNAKFECPSCGTIISVLQMEKKFREPSRCSCGRRGGFKLISKEMVDTQRLVIEETPESLTGGEQPKRMNVFVKEDLVEPKMEEKTTPGSRVKVIGVLKEVPVPLSTGGLSTRFELAIEANNLIPLEETFEELDINEEDEKQIMELSQDPKILSKLSSSIAPSIWGYEEIKKSLILQLFGGVEKKLSDTSKLRGDIHILLIGDPGVAKSQLLTFMANISPKGRYVVGKSASGAGLCVSPKTKIISDNGKIYSIKERLESMSNFEKEYIKGIYYDDDVDFKIQSMSDKLRIQEKIPSKIWKLTSPEEIYKITTIFGKEIELTGNTCLFTQEKKWKKALELKLKDRIAVASEVKVKGKEKYCVDLIDSNPVVHNIKDFVKKLTKDLTKKYGTLRNASKKLNLPENSLYYNWINLNARGNIKLNSLKKICFDLKCDYRDYVKEVSLYNGKKHLLPLKLNKDFLYLAGLIAGDGDLRKGENNTISIRFSNSNEVLQEIFRKIIKEQFNLNFDVQEGNSKRPEATRFNSKLIGEILLKLGICVSPKSNKLSLSNELLSLKDELLAEYIAGFYDSDGSVFVRKGKGSNCIELTSVSEKLMKTLQLVLLRYNIQSSLRTRKPSAGKIKGKYLKYVLEIRQKQSIKNFYEKIKLRHSFKKEKLKKLAKSILKKKSELILFEKIKKIEKIKSPYKYVYDLTIDNTHNFVANGILVHNTATVVRDEYLKGWSLEAGAMVLANKGLVSIDELEKMDPQDRSAMHEALEQQSVTISKANVQASLRAATSVLAAANPKFGRFDPYQSIAQQIDLPPTLINRFDVIFTLRDLPDKLKDDKIASHVLNQHRAKGKEMLIPRDLFRKYVAYAKQRYKPVLTDEAIQELKKFYVELRNKPVASESSMRPIPISARQLQALVRMSEASARLKLKQEVVKEDAQEAIELMKYYLIQVGYDYESKTFDIDRISIGVSSSQRSKIINVRETIELLEGRLGSLIPVEELQKELEDKMSKSEIDEAISKLQASGDIFKPRRGYVQRT